MGSTLNNYVEANWKTGSGEISRKIQPALIQFGRNRRTGTT
jgi:hypothetical protein